MEQLSSRRCHRAIRAGVLFALMLALLSPVSARPASALASDSTIFADDFEGGSLSNWTVTTAVNGTAQVQSDTGYGGTKAARLTVPDYGNGSIAYMKKTLDQPVYALSAVGHFNVLSGGCDNSAGYSAGSVPFFRFFDANGKRLVGIARINGNCGGNTKMTVQHSGNYYRISENLRFATWYKIELRATVSEPSASLVQVFVNDRKVYESTIANNGIRPFASVNTHNEHTNQVGDLLADNIRLATFDSGPPPTNPCDANAALPATSDPGSVVLADGFESYDFSQWSTDVQSLSGDGTATIQTQAVRSGNCAVRLHVTSSTASKANLSKTLPSGTSEVWTDGWFNVEVEGLSGSNVPLFRYFNGDARVVDLYRANGSGQLYLRTPNGSGGYTYAAMGRVLALGQWYNLKVHSIANGNSSTVEVWLNGTRLYTTGSATLGVASFGLVMIGAEHFAQAGDLVADDIVIKRVP